MMADMMQKKNYDLTEITRLLLEMRENCIPKAGNAYEDPNRVEKYDALNAAIDLINNPSMLAQWISVKDRLPEESSEVLFVLYGKVYLGDYLLNEAFETPAGSVFLDDEAVTHWMPLPEAPKEG